MEKMKYGSIEVLKLFNLQLLSIYLLSPSLLKRHIFLYLPVSPKLTVR